MPRGAYRGGNSKEAHKRYIALALASGGHEWPPHSYEVLEGRLGKVVLYFIQGMLMSVWHVGSGYVAHIPLLHEQDGPAYSKHQAKFERSVRALEEESKR